MSDRLEIAGRALQRPLCNHCLGRLFASVSRGLSNDQRGALIRGSLVGAPPPPEKRSDCPLCKGLFEEVEKFADIAAKTAEEYEFSTFLVGTKIDAELVENEEAFWTEVGARETESLKTEMNREIGKALEHKLDKKAEFANPEIVFLVDTRFDKVNLDVAPLFIYGRYRKYSRSSLRPDGPAGNAGARGAPTATARAGCTSQACRTLRAQW